MEHLENDMDDLFQKAGELYPLKTSGSDWEAVLGKLNEEGFGDQQSAAKVGSKGSGSKRKWLLLLLLISLSAGSIVYFSSSENKNRSSASNQVNITKVHRAATLVNTPNSKVSASIKPVPMQTQTGISKKYASHKRKTNKLINQSENSDIQRLQSDLSNGIVQQNRFSSSNKRERAVLSSEIINANLALSDNSSVNQTDLQRTLAEKPLSLSVVHSNDRIKVDAIPLPSTSKSANDPLPVVHSMKPEKKSINKGFYVGFLGGPDVSMVKFQSVKQLGFSLGAIIGYRFNKRFSVETGLLWDKKYYYSDGEYFKKSGTMLPPYTSILTVNGNCNMWEIPISLRYDFAMGTNHLFFVKGGFSSYIMKHQNYVASVDNSGSNPWNYPFQSNQTKNYFLSIAQLSAGYEYSTSAKTKLSFEPYVKIPLQGFGIGNMPISSTGFYIGIIYSFH